MEILSLVFLSSHTWLGLGLRFNEVKSILQVLDMSGFVWSFLATGRWGPFPLPALSALAEDRCHWNFSTTSKNCEFCGIMWDTDTCCTLKRDQLKIISPNELFMVLSIMLKNSKRKRCEALEWLISIFHHSAELISLVEHLVPNTQPGWLKGKNFQAKIVYCNVFLTEHKLCLEYSLKRDLLEKEKSMF